MVMLGSNSRAIGRSNASQAPAWLLALVKSVPIVDALARFYPSLPENFPSFTFQGALNISLLHF